LRIAANSGGFFVLAGNPLSYGPVMAGKVARKGLSSVESGSL
jgi:hypothetical protein